MSIELRRPAANEVPELGHILYEAFRDIAESHGFPSDFPSEDFARFVFGLLLQQERVHTAALYAEGAPRGSSFLNMWGDVAGVGPVSVAIEAQGGGFGRRIMLDMLEHAKAQGFEMVRLCQDSFNMRSLALYASLGFDVKEPVAEMALSAAGPVDAAFRAATPGDFEAMDALCRQIYRVSRRGEYDALTRSGFPAFVLDRGRITGYLLSTALGHGVAESDDDMLALLSSMGATLPNAMATLPMRSGDLYRRAVAAGHRNVKVMNLMALGPYEEPQGTYCPSTMF
jgi:GNAT superfamily N-acetyltransferase